MFPVAAATAAGWLLLFFVLLVIPAQDEGTTPELTPGAEPPAVVSLLAGGSSRADSWRRWLTWPRGFRLSGVPGPAGPVMCVVPARSAWPRVGRRPDSGGAPRPVLIIDFNQC